MSEIPDFSHHERDEEPIPGLSPDDSAFLAELDVEAAKLFEEADRQQAEADLDLCKQAYADTVARRGQILKAYVHDIASAITPEFVKENEMQLYVFFCEYVDFLLHAPASYGPRIALDIANALSMADASQEVINESKDKKRQLDNEKLKESMVKLFMMGETAEIQAVVEELYKKHIRDVVVDFVNENEN